VNVRDESTKNEAERGVACPPRDAKVGAHPTGASVPRRRGGPHRTPLRRTARGAVRGMDVVSIFVALGGAP
jgi:hypothetical protein